MTLGGALLTGAGTTLVLAVIIYTAFRAGYRHAQILYHVGGAKMITDYTPPATFFPRAVEASDRPLIWGAESRQKETIYGLANKS